MNQVPKIDSGGLKIEYVLFVTCMICSDDLPFDCQ